MPRSSLKGTGGTALRPSHQHPCRTSVLLERCIARLAGGGRGTEEPLSAIAMVLQAAPGDDDLPPPVRYV